MKFSANGIFAWSHMPKAFTGLSVEILISEFIERNLRNHHSLFMEKRGMKEN
jgi:hypothetical protein